MRKILFCTTCKGRTEHLRQTLPRNLADNPGAQFLVLNYNSDDGLLSYLENSHSKEIAEGQLIVYSCFDSPIFRMAHAKNMAARLGLAHGAEILVTLDADNFAGLGFAQYIEQKFSVESGVSFLTPEFAALPRPGHRFNGTDPLLLGRGFAGRLAIRGQDWIKVGGYDEEFETWRGEDMDIIERLRRLGMKQGFLDPCYLNAISHGAGVRFKEYPDAQRFESTDVYSAAHSASNTVVNFGQVGCGTVFRDFDLDTRVEVNPLPTRLFGIGFQRTGTTSLHEAFRLLGLDSGHWKSGDWAQAIWQEMHRWGRSRVMEADYALSDNPIPLLFRELDRGYPGSKFVLTVRDEASWLRSVEALWDYERNPQRWTWDRDKFSHKVHGIAYGRVDFEPGTFLARYRRHNAEVREYFAGREGDLLVLDLGAGDGWEELCQFLALPVPSAPFPRAHQTREVGSLTGDGKEFMSKGFEASLAEAQP